MLTLTTPIPQKILSTLSITGIELNMESTGFVAKLHAQDNLGCIYCFKVGNTNAQGICHVGSELQVFTSDKRDVLNAISCALKDPNYVDSQLQVIETVLVSLELFPAGTIDINAD